MTQKEVEAQWCIFKAEAKAAKTDKFNKWAAKDAEYAQRIVSIKKEIAARRETLKTKHSEILGELHGMKRAGLTPYNEKYEERRRALEDVESDLAALKMEQDVRLANNEAERVEYRRKFETVMAGINANLRVTFAELWAKIEIKEKTEIPTNPEV